MSTAIDEIIKSLEECKREKYTAIDTEKFLEYVYTVKEEEENEDTDHQRQLEQTRYNAECELHKECYRAQCESNLEMFRSIGVSGQNALKVGLLINGGASIAVLAFVGNIVNTHVYMLPYLTNSLLWFAWGTIAVGISAFLTYATQLQYGASKEKNDLWKKSGAVCHFLTILIGMLAAICFLLGVSSVYWGLSTDKDKQEKQYYQQSK